MLGAAAAAITPAVGTEPVKDSRLMPGCRGERAHRRRRPVPWTTLNTPAGSPASCGDVGQQRRRQRRPLRRLDHDGVAGREGRADPPGGEHQRRVPRRDDRDDAGRVEGDPLAVAADLAVSCCSCSAQSAK